MGLSVWRTQAFKTNLVEVVLRQPLAAASVTANALVPFVLRRGTERHPTSLAMARFLEELYGADLSVDVAKIGESQNLRFHVEVAAERFLPGERDLFRKALGLLREVVLEPRRDGESFHAPYFQQERENLRRGIEGLVNDKRQYAVIRLVEEMYRGRPYGLYKYGRVEDLPSLDPQGLYRHYRNLLETSPVEIFVVGDLDPEDVARWVEAELPLRPARPQALVPTRSRPADPAGRTVREEQPVQQGVLTMGWTAGATYADDGYEALLAANGLLGAFPHSKLFMNVRERASLAYFAFSRYEASQGFVYASAGINVENYERSRVIIEEQVEALRRGDFTSGELEKCRRSLVSSYRSMQDSGERMIDTFLVGLANGRPRDPDEVIARLERIDPGTIRDAAESLRLATVYFLSRPQEASGGQAAVREEVR
ncbi:EF-P 5-aminopentanol modification-associated protein YfmF [Limnochorda pilosa]|uniref:EF-P 5-aminopentanol modification-associated protein YfmF n=1 Tax=Limnochorda pilosa TaxID=1555112 RepID=UPI0008295D76|nr:pitrilysin family protein [Limnochorda pilosa]